MLDDDRAPPGARASAIMILVIAAPENFEPTISQNLPDMITF